MIDIEKFQAEIQKNMQSMVNEYKQMIRENRDLKIKIKQLECQSLAVNIPKIDKNAVVIFAADTSSSMDDWCRSKGRSYAEKVTEALRQRYDRVFTRYIHHYTEAKLVKEDEFLVLKDHGGTICSSAYRLINKELEDFNYESDKLDVYVFHISDGDNLTSDNARTINLTNKILNKVTKFYYVETNQYNRFSTLLGGFKKFYELMNNSKFNYSIIADSKDVDLMVRDFTSNIYIENLNEKGDVNIE